MTQPSRKLPKAILRELARIKGDRVVAATVLTITDEQITDYHALGLRLSGGKVLTGDPAPPPPSGGLHARRNIEGWDEKRTDLPKELRTISHLAPSWNNGGFHLVSREVEAYPVEHHPAKLMTISASVLEQLVGAALVRFRVDQPLNLAEETAASDLHFNLRLLREAVGDSHVFDADLTDEEFSQIQRVDWELLPRGSAEKVLTRLAAQKGVDAQRMEVARERLRVLDQLDHDGFIVGTGKFARYFGARFGDQLVLLESLEYGNALYAFEANWEQHSQLSRTELVKRRDPSVHRIPHLPGWQSAVRKLVRRHRANAKLPIFEHALPVLGP